MKIFLSHSTRHDLMAHNPINAGYLGAQVVIAQDLSVSILSVNGGSRTRLDMTHWLSS